MYHIVALSGGKDSTAMALRLAELNPDIDYDFVCTPTGEELPAMLAHWDNLGKLLGKPLTMFHAEMSFAARCLHYNALPNFRMRWCTPELKLAPFREYILSRTPVISYIGLRADEDAQERTGAIYGDIIGVLQSFPLREWGWGLTEVADYLNLRGVCIPLRTDCGCCFFQGLSEWHTLWKYHLTAWMRYELLESITGHTFRSDGRDTWPASLKGLRERFEAGDIPTRSYKIQERKSMCRVCQL